LDSIKKLIGRVDGYQRSHPWLGFPLAVGKKFGDDQGGYLAALVAYYGFFSLLPPVLRGAWSDVHRRSVASA
jgi:membrane protein